jgi:hypothetical protein
MGFMIGMTKEVPSVPCTASASHFTEPPGVPATNSNPRAGALSRQVVGLPPCHHGSSPVMLPGSPSMWIVYSSPPLLPRHCLRSRPLSVARLQIPISVTLPCCLTAHGTWFLGLQGPTSTPTSGSLSTSSRRMALLTGTRLVGSSEGSLSAPRWTTMRPSAPSSSLPLSELC